jgi:hypothetical protein
LNEENDKLYLVLDTLKPEYGIEVGDEYEVTFEIGADNPLVNDPETATTSFTVVERRVELSYTGDVIVVENETTRREHDARAGDDDQRHRVRRRKEPVLLAGDRDGHGKLNVRYVVRFQ